MSTVDLDAIRARNQRAHEEVRGLCDGSRKWTMRIPAQPERDSDLVIAAALADVETLAAEVVRAHAETQEIAAELAQERTLHQRTLGEVERLRVAACTALCRDVEDDRDRLRADLDVMYRVRDDLAAEVERLRAALADEQAAHAKTSSNFDEFAESAIEERDRLRHALDDARRERTRARQAFIELVNGGASTGGDSADG